MVGRFADLVGVAVATVAAVVVILSPDGGPTARVLLAVPLVLVLPGYAVAAAAFPGRSLNAAGRLAFSLGLSLALAMLVGLVLEWTPRGLHASSWAALLAATTLAATGLALARRLEQPVGTGQPGGAGLDARQVLILGLAVVVTAVAVEVARMGAHQPVTPGFTQLWIRPASSSDTPAVRLGIRSMERGSVRFGLRLETGGSVLREWPALDLQPAQRWETIVTLPAGQADRPTVEAVLYRLDSPQSAYRRVVLWRNGSGA